MSSSPAHGASPQPDASCATPIVPVLLVDDEDDIRYLTRVHLERAGRFRVVGEAADGVHAIEQAERLAPEVILLDVVMPRKDGATALPELRRVVPGAMVVVLSSLERQDHEQPLLDAGAFAYLDKFSLGEGFAELLTELHDQFRAATS